MLIISVIPQLGTKEEEIFPKLSELTGYKIIDDDYIVSLIKNNLGYTEKKIKRYLFAPSGLIPIDKIKRLHFLALFRMYLGKTLLDGKKIFTGFGTYLLPREANGILRLCLGANINFRIGNYAKNKKITIELATKKVKEYDRNLFFFTKTYLKKNPYEPKDFHLNIDVEKYKKEEIIDKILDLVHNWNFERNEDTKTILQDYVIENRILAIFLGEKEEIDVNFRNGKLTLFVKKQKIRMKNYFEYLRSNVPQLLEIKDIEISFSNEIKL